MSSNTKIVVLHMKEIMYTVLFAGLGILLILLLIFMFLPKNSSKEESASTAKYTAGVYSSSIMLNNMSFDVEVCVDDNHINSINLVNLSESVATMYPLMQPTLESVESQILATQSLDGLTYSDENKYTSLLLIDAIDNALKKAVR